MAILWVHKITHAGTAAAWLRLAAIAKTVSIFPSFILIKTKAFFSVFRLIPRSDFTHVGQVAEVATEYRIRASPLHHPPPARTAINSETALRGDRPRGEESLLFSFARLFPGGCCCCVELLRCRGHGGARVVTGVVGGGTKGISGRTDGQTEVERARRFPLQMQLLAAAAAAEESPCRAQKG